MTLKIKRTKKQELTEQLIIERCIRIGLCACLKNLIEEHTKLLGGDQEKAIANVESGLQKTAASIKIQAKDIKGESQNISDVIQRGVEQMLNMVFRDVRKKLSPKSVH